MTHTIVPIAYIKNDFTEKFGIPRQPGLCDKLVSKIEFTPEFRNVDALRGMEGFSHLWLIWQFSESLVDKENWTPTVRPPRLGGNVRVGVFATRSPFRPNSLGLSCVEIESIDFGNVCIYVKGADLMNGTPIFDIKPYVPYSDSKPDALEGFAPMPESEKLEVIIPSEFRTSFPPNKLEGLKQVLANDPRPRYITDEAREFGMVFAEKNVKFTVNNKVLTITEIK